ncbi:MAG: type I-B CRISPR-associated protein Cas7/Cst2/DevR [Myxococcota bacterium]
MATHVFAAILTHHGTAANNRGETDGNTTTLQKLVWHGSIHTTVSAESIRFALRRRLAEFGETLNRTFDPVSRQNAWTDPAFAGWTSDKGTRYADDDLLGFMSAEAAKEETGGKGTTRVRRAVLEVARAVSLEPWAGDVTFNAASPGATPSAAKKGSGNPVPYATEMHATRYQYGVALTPDDLHVRARAAIALRGLCCLGEVAGNHGRFLYDFSPEVVVFRITQDPAPRLLYCFDQRPGGVGASALVSKVVAGDIPGNELIVGGRGLLPADEQASLSASGAALHDGVLAALAAVTARLPA